MEFLQRSWCQSVCFSLIVCKLIIVILASPLDYPLFQSYQTTRLTYSNNSNVNSAQLELYKISLNNGRKTNEISSERLEVGSLCRRKFDGKSGYCLLAYQCLHTVKEFREHGVKIDVCSYLKRVAVICCPLDKKQLEPKEKRLSLRKCEEYNEQFKNVIDKDPKEFSGKKCVASVPLIVGGELTQTGEYPHMAALGWIDEEEESVKWGCGASLISDRFLLTAAHCTSYQGKQPDIVILGTQNIEDIEGALQVDISEIILHAQYRVSSYYHDIALIKLTKRVEFTDYIQPACLWQYANLNIPEAMATGWGRTEFLGGKSDELRKVDLKIIDPMICKKVYQNEPKLQEGIIEKQFCAGHLNGIKDTCQGDSGGPIHAMVPELNCVQFIIGITSFGKYCAAPNSPGVYTNISAYLDWIEKYAFE